MSKSLNLCPEKPKYEVTPGIKCINSMFPKAVTNYFKGTIFLPGPKALQALRCFPGLYIVHIFYCPCLLHE